MTMTAKQKKTFGRIIIAALMVVVLHFIPSTGLLRFILYMIPYLVIGYDILLKAARNIAHGQVFDECFLMCVATLGAIALAIWEGSGDYTEAVAVMLFYQIGEFFQGYAVSKSRKSISELMDIRPDSANIEQDGSLVTVDPDDVAVGSIIVVRPGEKVPIDGVVTSGASSLDTSALTGEPVPRSIHEGDEVASGCVNLSGEIHIRTTKEAGESTASKILDLVENAGSRKSRSEDFITRFSRVYTPAVCIAALALALLPPLVRLAMGLAPTWHDWIYRALTFLVISCPCALVISIPLSFFAGIGGASREGVLVKGSNYLEALSKVRTVVFDKTGTLTKGVFTVNEVHHNKLPRQEVLGLAAHAEASSSHPVARSIEAAWDGKVDRKRIAGIQEYPGEGVTASVDDKAVAVGNGRLMSRLGIEAPGCHCSGTLVHVAVDGSYEGHLVISDVIKPNAKAAIDALHASGVQRCVMLTGDRMEAAKDTASSLGIDEVHAQLLPGDKVSALEGLMDGSGKALTAFVGDGINDAPVLSRADVGIAMGAMGSDAAIEAADVVLMDDDPLKVAKAIRLSRRCMRIVWENIIFALGVKGICLLLGAFGIANMWLAIFADVGVMVIAVLNAIRALKAGRT